MTRFITVYGSDRIAKKLKQRATSSKANDNGAVIVGFTQKYALYVHESTKAKHKVGQAKFLEAPARALRGQFSSIIRKRMKGGATLRQALYVAGLRLQREAQQLTPVDTGALKASAFTADARDEETAFVTAYARSETQRRHKKR